MDIPKLIAESNGHTGRRTTRRTTRLVRVVLRLDPAMIERIEAVQGRQPAGTSRAAVARALILLGLEAEETRKAGAR